MDPSQSLLQALGDFEELVRQEASADPQRVQEVVTRLTECVCETPPDFGAAARVQGRPGVTYQGRRWRSYTDVVYLAAMNHYQAMEERLTGFPDDELIGSLDAEKVAARWPEVAAEIAKGLLAPGELALLAREVEREQALATPKPSPPPPLVYRPPGPAEHRWSAAAAQAQAARLATYRDGPPPAPGPSSDDVTDRLEFVPGESADRFVTKVGGLPYRPAGQPWPCQPSGAPMTFVAQICFADSADLAGQVPGDVVLLFAKDEHAFVPSSYDLEPALLFEWYPLGLEGLATAADVPATPWRPLPYYGRVERVAEEAGGLEGTKLGGVPHWIQHELEVEGSFLFALGAVGPRPTVQERQAGYRRMELGDAGLVNFFVQPDGDFIWALQCY
jgi:hypothetical protein